MLKILGVKKANYYKWLNHEKSTHDLENEELAGYIKKYDEMFDHTLGYRMMTDRINRDEHKHYNDKQVYKVMRILGIQSIIRPKRRSCTVRKNNNTAKNNLKREFNTSRPNEKWVTDVTEFKYGKHNENKLYLSLILDLYDRFPVGYEISNHNDNTLVFDTFEKAIATNPNAHPLFHSDGGYQYTSSSFVHMLKENKMKQSMSRVAHCIDNGPMEGFWGILKLEMYYGKRFTSKEELIQSIQDYIEYYNNRRLQRKLHIMTPMDFHELTLKAA